MASIRAGRRRIVLPAIAAVVLVFAVSFSRSGSVGPHMPSTEEEARDYHEMKSKTAAKDENEKDKSSESWTEWAKEKISGGLGLKTERHEGDAKRDTDFTADNVKKAKDEFENAASEAHQYGAEKVREAKDSVAENAVEAREKAAKMADTARETAAEKTTEAKEQGYNAARSGKEKTGSLNNKAEDSVGEAKERAEAAEAAAGKRKIGEEYEAAKNKSQQSEAEDEL